MTTHCRFFRALILQSTSANPLPRLLRPAFIIVNVFFYIYEVRDCVCVCIVCIGGGFAFAFEFGGVLKHIFQVVMISIYFANNNSLSPDAYNGDAYMVAGTTLCASLLSAILAIALMRKLSQTMQVIQEKTHATGGSLRMLKVLALCLLCSQPISLCLSP